MSYQRWSYCSPIGYYCNRIVYCRSIGLFFIVKSLGFLLSGYLCFWSDERWSSFNAARCRMANSIIVIRINQVCTSYDLNIIMYFWPFSQHSRSLLASHQLGFQWAPYLATSPFQWPGVQYRVQYACWSIRVNPEIYNQYLLHAINRQMYQVLLILRNSCHLLKHSFLFVNPVYQVLVSPCRSLSHVLILLGTTVNRTKSCR